MPPRFAALGGTHRIASVFWYLPVRTASRGLPWRDEIA